MVRLATVAPTVTELCAVVAGWMAVVVVIVVFGLNWITPLFAIAVTMAMYFALKMLR